MRSTGGVWRLAQEIIGARQQHGDDAGSRHRRDARLRPDVRDGRPTARRIRAASAAPCRLDSWSACSLTGRPRPARRLEYAGDLVAARRRSSRRRRRPRRPGPRGRAPGSSRRRPTRYRPRGSPANSGGRAWAPRKVVRTVTRRCSREAPRDAERLELVGEIEPVAGLDLDGGDALGDQRVEPRQRRRQQARPRSAARVAAQSRGCRRRRGRSPRSVAPASRSSNSRARSPP